VDEFDKLVQANEDAAMHVMAAALNAGMDSTEYADANTKLLATRKALQDFVRKGGTP